MSNTIHINTLSAQIAAKTGHDESVVRQFISQYFEYLAETLAEGQKVEIPGIGVLVRDYTTSDGVYFAPDAGLEGALNLPFSAFAPVPVADDFDTSLLNDSQPEEPTPPPFEGTMPEEAPSATIETPVMETGAPAEPGIEPSPEPSVTPTQNAEQTPEPDTKTVVEQAPETPQQYIAEPVYYEDGYTRAQSNPIWPKIVWAAIGLLLGLIVGIAIGYLCYPRISSMICPVETVEMVQTIEDVNQTDSIVDTATESEPLTDTVVAPVLTTDTVKSTRFLTTMAREHYNQMEYWVYIYDANDSILGHPDRIKPGTVVVIPDINRYVDTTATAEIRIDNAKRHATEIYGRFK